MAACSKEKQFKAWLSEFFTEHNIDEDIYLDYVTGILHSGEESPGDDLTGSIEEVFTGVFENSEEVASISTSIVKKFQEMCNTRASKPETDPSQGPSLLTHIHEQTLSNMVAERTPSKKTTSSISDSLSDEQKKKLIRTYGTQSDDDNFSSDGEDSSTHRHSGSGRDATHGLMPNLNAAAVVQKQKQQREKQKEQHEAKVERDKQSRQKQLQKEQERKEREKKRTQKQERRRQ